jgi:hypothetical protein
MGLVPNERWFFAGSHKVPGTLLLLARSYCSVFAPPFSARNLVPGTNFSAASEGAWHPMSWRQNSMVSINSASSDLASGEQRRTGYKRLPHLLATPVTMGLVPKGTMIF